MFKIVPCHYRKIILRFNSRKYSGILFNKGRSKKNNEFNLLTLLFGSQRDFKVTCLIIKDI